MSATEHAELDLLRELPLLQLVPAELRQLVIASFVAEEHPFGSVIVRQGDAADAMFVLTSGRTRVLTTTDTGDEVALATLEPGAVIGESALLDGALRTATVRASEPARVLRLDGGLLRGLAAAHPGIAESMELELRRNQLDVLFERFPSFSTLSGTALVSLLEHVEDVEVSAGEDVIVEGDPPGAMYVVLDGRLRAHRDDRSLRFYRRGELFGERSTITDSVRGATVSAVTDVSLLAIPAGVLAELVAQDPDFRRELQQLVDQYAYQDRAVVPEGFEEELIPAAARVAGSDGDISSEPSDAAFASQRTRRIRRMRLTYQVDEADCGAACLVMVARHHGARISIARARQACGTTTGGSSLAGIVAGAKAIGLDARAVKVSFSKLDELTLPAAAHLDGNHWVVVHDVGAERVIVADPARGRRVLRRAEFLERWTGYTAVFAPGPDLERQSLAERTAFLRPFLIELRPSIIMATLLAIVVSGMQLLLPIYSRRVIDDVLGSGNTDLLRSILFGLGATTMVIASAGLIQGFLLGQMAADFDRRSLSTLTRRLFSLPMRYFMARRVGDIQRRLEGLAEVREFIVSNASMMVTSVLRLVVSLALLINYDAQLSLIWLATVPLNLGMIRWAASHLRPLADGLEEHAGRYASKQVEAIESVETVKAMGAEIALGDELVADFAEMTSRRLVMQRASLRYGVVFDVIEFAGLAALLLAGALRVDAGAMTIGEFVAFNAIAALATAPIDFLVSVFDQVQDAAIMVTRLQDIFVEEPEHDDTGMPAPGLTGAVTLRDVTVQYGGPESPRVLDGVNLEVRPGETIAVVGRSGSGKSTLVRCLAGLVAPSEGAILFDGFDLAEMELTSVRHQIGMVLQDSFLFSDTLRRNIAFGDPDVDPARVEWAARIANAHAFIARLPLGYETKVGETGVQLSGGQRQRISIARAVYRDPAIVLLDEATSALDTESERAVQENLGKLLSGRTSFVIAHRLSTVRDASRIVVLDDGKVAELGTHEELMDRQGLYFYLVSQQLSL